MGEEGGEAEFIAQTQATLGSLISKPKMTEKYLKKPPFRFLHDICMETIKATSFAQGLYSPEECDAAGLADKQAKVDFLNKMISAVSFSIDEPVNVAANKIVAGLDADKTNAFLVKLHFAATTCVGPKSESAVQRVLAGETVAAPKKKEKKEKKDDAPPETPAAPSGDGGDAAAAEAAAEEEKKKKAAEKKRRDERKKKEAEAAAAAEAAAGDAAAAEAKAAEEEEKRRQKEAARAAKEEKKRQEEEAQAAAAAQAEDDRRRQEEAAAQAQAAQQQAQPEEMGGQDMMMGQADGDIAGVRKLERPRTAGRKPPKVVSKVMTKTDEPGLSQGVAPPALIADGVKEDDDDDMFEAPAQGKVIAVNSADGEAHGKLVRDILAEKKEKEKEEARRKEQAKEEEAEDGAGGIKMGRLKRKKDNSQALAQVDIDKLAESIQELCQAVNPLGKSIDLVYQDIANMGKELDHWKQENRDAAELYQRELKNTEDTLVPLYRKIQELDEKIADQRQSLGNARSRIAKNDVHIQNLLEAVVVTK